MSSHSDFVDIHCHLLPGIDDGSDSLEESIKMAKIAVDEGIAKITVTPHQLGAYRKNTADLIRQNVIRLQQSLTENQIDLSILPGGDVRIEVDLVDRLKDGTVLTLGDHGKHVLLELPHETYFSLDLLLKQLNAIGITGILSHPERNAGILDNPSLVDHLVDRGCLMQITAGSILGTFGPQVQRMAVSLLNCNVVHFVSTDAHGSKRRRPLMRKAYEKTVQRVGSSIANNLFREHPALVADGENVPSGRLKTERNKWFRWAKTG